MIENLAKLAFSKDENSWELLRCYPLEMRQEAFEWLFDNMDCWPMETDSKSKDLCGYEYIILSLKIFKADIAFFMNSRIGLNFCVFMDRLRYSYREEHPPQWPRSFKTNTDDYDFKEMIDNIKSAVYSQMFAV